MARSVTWMVLLVLAHRVHPAHAKDLFLRPPSACSTNGDGQGYACAGAAGGPGAFNSWSSANAAAKPGDVVRIDGQWQPTSMLLFTADGTTAAPIRITSYDPKQPALLRNVGLGTCILYVEADHVVVDHLRFNTDSSCCLYIGQEGPTAIHTGIEVRDNLFERCQSGISVTYLDGAEIHDNVLNEIGYTDSNQGHCIYLAQGSRNARAFRNRCTAKVNVQDSHCLHVYHAEPPGPAQDAEFHDNLCLGFTVGAGLYSGSKNIRVYGNTFVVRKNKGLTCRYGGSQGAFVNNIIIGDATHAAFLEDAACQLTIDHNIYYRPGGSFLFSLPGQSGASWSDWQKVHDTASFLVDPQLVDAAGGDLHLKATSPARDKGDNAFASSVDFYGAPRISNGVVDIGAAEYVAPGLPDRTPREAGQPAAADGSPRSERSGAADSTLVAGDAAAPGRDSGAQVASGCGCRLALEPAGSGWPVALLLVLILIRRREVSR